MRIETSCTDRIEVKIPVPPPEARELTGMEIVRVVVTQPDGWQAVFSVTLKPGRGSSMALEVIGRSVVGESCGIAFADFRQPSK